MKKLLLILMIVPMIGFGQNLNRQEITQILTTHNKYRLDLNLPELVWSKNLVNSSQKWADKLISMDIFEHSNTKNGENLFVIMGRDASPIEVVDDWASEKEYFNYETRKCNGSWYDCGHYTQIIWRDTKEVGCAVSKLGTKQIWVCQYNPPGNYTGEKTY